jgi:hypothetical protein
MLGGAAQKMHALDKPTTIFFFNLSKDLNALIAYDKSHNKK